MAATHVDLLYEGLTGVACLFIGIGGHFDGGHYAFTSTSQLFFAWPKQRSDLLDTAMRRAPTDDVFLGTLLRTQRSRKKGSAGHGRYVWADSDGPWTDALGARLAGLMSPGSSVVLSGTSRHVYIRLARPFAGV